MGHSPTEKVESGRSCRLTLGPMTSLGNAVANEGEIQFRWVPSSTWSGRWSFWWQNETRHYVSLQCRHNGHYPSCLRISAPTIADGCWPVPGWWSRCAGPPRRPLAAHPRRARPTGPCRSASRRLRRRPRRRRRLSLPVPTPTSTSTSRRRKSRAAPSTRPGTRRAVPWFFFPTLGRQTEKEAIFEEKKQLIWRQERTRFSLGQCSTRLT